MIIGLIIFKTQTNSGQNHTHTKKLSSISDF